MKTYLASIVALVSLRSRASSEPSPREGDSHGELSRPEACWDEALISTMYDENARMLFGRLGPFWR